MAAHTGRFGMGGGAGGLSSLDPYQVLGRAQYPQEDQDLESCTPTQPFPW